MNTKIDKLQRNKLEGTFQECVDSVDILTQAVFSILLEAYGGDFSLWRR